MYDCTNKHNFNRKLRKIYYYHQNINNVLLLPIE